MFCCDVLCRIDHSVKTIFYLLVNRDSLHVRSLVRAAVVLTSDWSTVAAHFSSRRLRLCFLLWYVILFNVNLCCIFYLFCIFWFCELDDGCEHLRRSVAGYFKHRIEMFRYLIHCSIAVHCTVTDIQTLKVCNLQNSLLTLLVFCVLQYCHLACLSISNGTCLSIWYYLNQSDPVLRPVYSDTTRRRVVLL